MRIFSLFIISIITGTLFGTEYQDLPSVEKPLTITQTSTLDLTDNIVIDANGTPFIAHEFLGLNGPQKLIITSKYHRGIYVKSNCMWDLSSFDSKNKIIEFRGNARLVLEPGAHIKGSGGALNFIQSSKLLIE